MVGRAPILVLSEDSKGRFSAAICSQRHADILFQAISQYNGIHPV
jgi:hypothetical protein